MSIEVLGKGVFANRSFLLVEDFEAMRVILRDLLRRCGARRIEVAANASEAMNILRRGKCDVVLCDYHLGSGKNGQQLLAEARHEGLVNASNIWIMVTAEKTSEMVTVAVEHQPDNYLLKPVTQAALQSRLEKLITRKSALSNIAAAMRAKEYLKAVDLCKVRIKQDPGNSMEILRIKAGLYQLIGQPDKSRSIFDAILARHDVHWARFGLAKLHVLEGSLGRARDMLERLLEDNPSYLEAYDLLAHAYRRQGAWRDAQRVLTKAINASPNSPDRQNALGESALRCEDLNIAESAFKKALKLSAQSTLKTSAPYLGLARVFTAQSKPEEALKLLSQLANDIEGDEASLQGKAEEVRVHHASGNAKQAEAAAKEVTSRIQSGSQNLSPASTLDLAETFLLMGNKETACSLMQFVVRNNHENEELARRALEVFDKGGLGEEGRAMVQSSRQHATEAMNNGVRLASEGKLNEALEFLNQAKALMPRNPRLLLNHAYVVIALLQKNGWRHDMETDARRSITIARQIMPGEKRCGELLAKLESLR
ncbi:tetratricopeptide repeat protein [Propionivibrio sp.]|uniref:tetratricopeptide repeat protein n=1 Tax=Propionivibrio sp. TaxID=2212460 RepID=UPI003BEFF171